MKWLLEEPSEPWEGLWLAVILSKFSAQDILYFTEDSLTAVGG